jgi:hypothetical protein
VRVLYLWKHESYDRFPPAASKSLRDFDAAQGIDKWKKEYVQITEIEDFSTEIWSF